MPEENNPCQDATREDRASRDAEDAVVDRVDPHCSWQASWIWSALLVLQPQDEGRGVGRRAEQQHRIVGGGDAVGHGQRIVVDVFAFAALVGRGAGKGERPCFELFAVGRPKLRRVGLGDMRS